MVTLFGLSITNFLLVLHWGGGWGIPNLPKVVSRGEAFLSLSILQPGPVPSETTGGRF